MGDLVRNEQETWSERSGATFTADTPVSTTSRLSNAGVGIWATMVQGGKTADWRLAFHDQQEADPYFLPLWRP